MAHIPIRSLTIYKQGIGHFRRRGTVADQTVSLVVPRASLNDLLKSLDIVVHAGGPVQSVDYETPANKSQQLADLAVQLADRAGLGDLLTSLRGSPVQVTLADGATLAGRVVGVEASLPGPDQPAALILQTEAALQLIPLASLRAIAIADPRAADDIRFFLDLSRSEESRTTLTVRLAPGTHDLELGYSAPSPTWRVSYRLAGLAPGRARLVAWGLFDNTLDEDLEAVELTLISGRPVSFSYDLAATRVPPRPQVSDDPTALEQLTGDRSAAEALSTIAHEVRSPLTSIRGYADVLSRGLAGGLSDDQRAMLTQIRDSAARITEHLNQLFDLVRIRDQHTPALSGSRYRAGPLGDLKVSASYFLPVQAGNAEQASLTYRAPTPISVRRGQAALVPILDTEVAYEELCVYNGAKLSNHPLRVWRIRNASGVALEQGPVTVTADGQYQGEGIVRFTGVGDSLQVPYALEFGVLVREDREHPPRALQGVRFNAETRRAEVGWYWITRTRYRLSSNIRRDLEVLVEHRDPPRGEYFGMPAPADAAEGHTRWAVALPAGGQAELVVQEREVRTSTEQVGSWGAETIEELRAAGGLGGAAYGLLQRLRALAAQDEAGAAEQKRLAAEREQLLALQEQLRKNLGALGERGREASLRDRLLDDLEASEERRRGIAAAERAAEEQRQAREAERQAILAELFAPG